MITPDQLNKLINQYRTFLIENKSTGMPGTLSYKLMDSLLDGFMAWYKVWYPLNRGD